MSCRQSHAQPASRNGQDSRSTVTCPDLEVPRFKAEPPFERGMFSAMPVVRGFLEVELYVISRPTATVCCPQRLTRKTRFLPCSAVSPIILCTVITTLPLPIMASSGSNTSAVELESYRATEAAPGVTHAFQPNAVISNQNQTEDEGVASQLQPADHGSAAWKLLWGAFVFEALLWGERQSTAHDLIVVTSLFANIPWGQRLPALLRSLPRLLLSTPRVRR